MGSLKRKHPDQHDDHPKGHALCALNSLLVVGTDESDLPNRVMDEDSRNQSTQNQRQSRLPEKVLDSIFLSHSSIGSRKDWDLPHPSAMSRFAHDSKNPTNESPLLPYDPQQIACPLQSSTKQVCVHEQRSILWAAARGENRTMAFLLSISSSDLSFKNYYGQTALSLAAEHGHVGILQLLLARPNIEVNIPDLDGQTPLAWAAFNGHLHSAKMLLDREDIVADSKDVDGNTPLAWAAANGHYAMAELLLKRFDVAIDSANLRGKTPRDLAMANGHLTIASLLALWKDEESY